MPDGSAVGIMYYQKKKNKVFEKIFMPYSNSNNAQFSFLFFHLIIYPQTWRGP